MAIKKKQHSAGEFRQRLNDYGKWQDKANMDRFVILVFLTAAEKAEWAGRHLGDPEACYIDGHAVATVELESKATKRSA